MTPSVAPMESENKNPVLAAAARISTSKLLTRVSLREVENG
jgi:hypothetical protein